MPQMSGIYGQHNYYNPLKEMDTYADKTETNILY